MKLGTNIYRVSGRCWKGFQCQGVEGQGWQRRQWKSCDLDSSLTDEGIWTKTYSNSLHYYSREWQTDWFARWRTVSKIGVTNIRRWRYYAYRATVICRGRPKIVL